MEIERLVTSMGGEIESKALTSISFIIAKDVLAAKYKVVGLFHVAVETF